MDILKLTTEELRAIDPREIKATEQEVRKKLAEMRMDVYTAAATNVGQIRGLKKTLARLKTVQNEKNRQAAKA